MKKQVLFGAIALIMLAGCAKEVPVESPPQKVQLSADEAKFLAQADGNTKFDH